MLSDYSSLSYPSKNIEKDSVKFNVYLSERELQLRASGLDCTTSVYGKIQLTTLSAILLT
jgi:mevalonate kinase